LRGVIAKIVFEETESTLTLNSGSFHTMIKATIQEAKTHLSKLIMEVESGKEVVLYRDKEPVARLVGLRRTDKKRPPAGVITSKPVHYSDDCFTPLTGEGLREWGI